MKHPDLQYYNNTLIIRYNMFQNISHYFIGLSPNRITKGDYESSRFFASNHYSFFNISNQWRIITREGDI